MAAPSALVFSDLDGTLLDKQSYSWAPAAPALDALARLSVPVILATSKTLPEVLQLRRAMGLDHPFIVENGAAAVTPQGYFPASARLDAMERKGDFLIKTFGARRDQILQLLHGWRAAENWRFEGFADWDAARLSEIAGLDPTAARAALERVASEPLLWRDTPARLDSLKSRLEEHRLRLVEGGRFLHVMGRFDKRDGLVWLRERYLEISPNRSLLTVALGDSPNDVEMLASADIAVIIRSDNAGRIALENPSRVIRTAAPGPAGWREAIERILPELSAQSA